MCCYALVVVFRHGNEANAWIVDVKRAWVEDRCATWAIVNPVTNEVLGRVAIQVKPAAGSGEISYWVLPASRRSGVATRAVVAATRWAHDVGLHRIEIQHSTANEPSGNVALAAGFTEEGVRRQATLHTDGWHDMRLYSHLATDQAPSENTAG